MNLINEGVRHAKFGSGEIIDIEQGRVIVKFDEQGEKSFAYPEAFELFLKLNSPQSQKDVMQQLDQKKELDLQEKKLKMEESIKREAELKEEKLELAKSKKKSAKSVTKKKMA